jgi:hypothetical protein
MSFHEAQNKYVITSDVKHKFKKFCKKFFRITLLESRKLVSDTIGKCGSLAVETTDFLLMYAN